MAKNLLLKAGNLGKKRKLSGAAARSHAKAGGRKSRAKAPRKGGGVTHRAYSYKNKSGKMVHVASHVEHPRSHR